MILPILPLGCGHSALRFLAAGSQKRIISASRPYFEQVFSLCISHAKVTQ
jgi:hypothetical protein